MNAGVSLVRAYLNLNGYFTATDIPVIRQGSQGQYRELTDIDVRPRAIVLNRALPPSWAEAALEPVTGIDDPAVAAELAQNLSNWGGEARRQAIAMEGLADRYGVPLVPVPWVADPPTDAKGLEALLKGVDLAVVAQ